MEFIGIDLHKKESQICILSETGELILEQRIKTEREQFKKMFEDRGPCRIVIESATESEWAARCLEELGCEVVVADPNFAPMYATRSKKVKTDKRDARALADACRLGGYRKAHRSSDEQRAVKNQLTVREALVRTRSRYISVVRAMLRQQGLRISSGGAESFGSRLTKVELPIETKETIKPLLTLMAKLNQQIKKADKKIALGNKKDPRCMRVQTAPGVGPITAAAFISTIDNTERFKNAHQVEAYVGLVPSERSSGEKQNRGGITKAGPPRIRWLLVQAAWGIVRSKTEESAPLRNWTLNIVKRRGYKVGVVALARKLCGILFAMTRDERDFEWTKATSGKGLAQSKKWQELLSDTETEAAV
jgi:transposase